MNKLAFSLFASAVGLFVNGAQAGPLTEGHSQIDIDNGLLRVQMVCDQHGNCQEHHRDRPAMIIQQDRHHEPRREYHEERPQQHGQPGIGIQVPGVSIGVGGNTHERR